MCEYKDSKGNAYRNRLDGLLLHVANHGIWHRAQALNFLKQFGRTVPGGIDFIFYRLAKPSITLDPAAVEALRKFGLEAATGSSPPVEWNAAVIRDYFAYGDWSNGRLLDLSEPLDASSLDRAFGMGLGTIRKTALHIADAERWWLKNWTVGPSQFEKAPNTTTIAELRSRWLGIVAERNKFIAALDASSAQRVVTALIGPLSIGLPVIESLVQLCSHGTHHRAQLVNMLRHNGMTARGTDYVDWLRQSAA
jgi:uncharacterized damage-inducible protein DinB